MNENTDTLHLDLATVRWLPVRWASPVAGRLLRSGHAYSMGQKVVLSPLGHRTLTSLSKDA